MTFNGRKEERILEGEEEGESGIEHRESDQSWY